MRTLISLLCTLLLFVSPFVVTYFEAASQFGCPCAVYEPFDVSLSIVLVLCSCLIAVTLPWIIVSFSEDAPK